MTAPPSRPFFGRIVRADAPTVPGTAPARPLNAAPPAPAPRRDAPEATFNGVPVSAAQHCCGKACKHCRIYWGLRKP